MEKPFIFALPFTEWIELVAQLVEQYTFNVWALGSSPSGFTNGCLSRWPFSILDTEQDKYVQKLNTYIKEHHIAFRE